MMTSPTQPLISIIVPVYNAEQYLRQCLDSLIKQTYGNLQIICVNDGSTDGSATILQQFAERDARITVLHQENKGQGAARNAGMAVACGKWIAGLDADDFLEPDALEYAVSMITGDIDIVCYSSVVEAARETRAEEYDYLRNPQDAVLTSPVDILEQVNVYFWNKLWRKSFIKELGVQFVEGLWYEDSAFAYCALPFARAVACGTRQVHHYRMHEHSIMTLTFARHPRAIEHLDVLEHVLKFYEQHTMSAHAPEAPSLVFRLLFGATMAHIPGNNKKAALLKASRIVAEHDLRRRFPQEGSINAARWIPWYLRPFFKATYSKREYRFLWLPFFQVRIRKELRVLSFFLSYFSNSIIM